MTLAKKCLMVVGAIGLGALAVFFPSSLMCDMRDGRARVNIELQIRSGGRLAFGRSDMEERYVIDEDWFVSGPSGSSERMHGRITFGRRGKVLGVLMVEHTRDGCTLTSDVSVPVEVHLSLPSGERVQELMREGDVIQVNYGRRAGSSSVRTWIGSV